MCSESAGIDQVANFKLPLSRHMKKEARKMGVNFFGCAINKKKDTVN